MKKLIPFFFVPILALGLSAQTIDIQNMTEGLGGSQISPAVAENFRGERIYCYRGDDLYVHARYYKNGTWGQPVRIPGSPVFKGEFWYSDIVADSEGTIHYVCEETYSHMWYAYFKDGAWSTMKRIEVRHDASLSLAVRSDDTLVLAAPVVLLSHAGPTKDILVGTKKKGESNFSRFVNVTNDFEASTMVDLAIDADDNSWIVYKDEYMPTKSMPASLIKLNKEQKRTYYKRVSGTEASKSWCWHPHVAINTDGKVMVTWFKSQIAQYLFRCFDTRTGEWSDIKPIASGTLHPWSEFYGIVLARGNDFYWIGLSPSRYLVLYKYDAKRNDWDKVGDVSSSKVNLINMSNGANAILIAWSTMGDPSSCYLTTVSADPYVSTRIQPVANLRVEKRVERGFFHGYYLNALTWEANPLNAEREIVVASQRVYRRLRTADAAEWTQLAEVGATVLNYEDRNLASDSDYVYAVTCVDDKGHESSIVNPSEPSSATRSVPGRRAARERADH